MLAAGDDYRFVKMVILPFGEDKADIFGLVGRDTLFINKNTGVQAVFFAVEDYRAVADFVDTLF